MDNIDFNLGALSERIQQYRDDKPDRGILSWMRGHCYAADTITPATDIAGIDSSDNLLLQIPGYPGAGVAGYAFSLVVVNPGGKILGKQNRMAERLADPEAVEPLEIAIIYSFPSPKAQQVLHLSDFQLSALISTPSGRSPYEDFDNPPEFKLRLAAARSRELTEKRAVRTYLFQETLQASLLLKDGRLSSQNCSTRYTDDLGRRCVERNIKYVGVVKQGTLLWNALYPYHKQLFQSIGCPYWGLVHPKLVWDVYGVTKSDQSRWVPKTLRLGSQENQSLAGIGGAWVIYGPSSGLFYILEFNLYDLTEYKHLVTTGQPLEQYNFEKKGWSRTYVVMPSIDSDSEEFTGTLTELNEEDLETLIAPIVGQIHHLATCSHLIRNYPIVLADAHRECKITKERKERRNIEIITELTKAGFQPVDFDNWSEDPHKLFDL